jgi:hypothetical protein
MAPQFIGKDHDSPEGGSPSLWDDGDSYVIQGPRVSDPAVVDALLHAAGQGQIPAHETLVRFPKRLMCLFPEMGSGR